MKYLQKKNDTYLCIKQFPQSKTKCGIALLKEGVLHSTFADRQNGCLWNTTRILIGIAHDMFQPEHYTQILACMHNLHPSTRTHTLHLRHTTHNSGTQITKFILNLWCHFRPPSSSVCSRNFSRNYAITCSSHIFTDPESTIFFHESFCLSFNKAEVFN